MNKEVNIIINSLIKTDEGKDDITANISGSYFEKGDFSYILYDEQSDDEKVSKCRLKFSTDRLELKKTGLCSTDMTFTREGITRCFYKTPYGLLNMEIETKQFDIVIDHDEIRILLKYELKSENSVMSHNEMTIKIISV